MYKPGELILPQSRRSPFNEDSVVYTKPRTNVVQVKMLAGRSVDFETYEADGRTSFATLISKIA
jgi:hypothetical protein